ncbi:MAG: alcohol dehydrogenase catalytic domain-containing protein [Planctomycetes bacterium]|nr:alcohol dehydrogenase catalytic domain-containing protein [Planctomycetota bacterium]
MKAAVLVEPDRIEIQEQPEPTPGKNEVVIRVRAVGICGSDTHYFAGMRDHEADTVYPFILGHEFSGEVAELGVGVENVEVGDRVGIAPDKPCGECEWCKKGEFNVCPNVDFAASGGVPGCLREYYVVHKSQLHPIPAHLGFPEATLAEPLAIGLHIVDNLIQPEGGEEYAIIGAGPIGLVTTFAARRTGASTIMVAEKREERLEAATKLGADETCLVSDQDFVDFVEEQTNGRGVDVAVEAAGQLDAIAQVAQLPRIHGLAIIEGIPPAGFAEIAVDSARRKELQIIFGRRSLNKTDDALDTVALGGFDADAMITHRFSLDEAQKAFETARDYKDGVIKAIIEP